ncbi:MAG: hypothetical protein QTN59_17305 [Candidatus Electrothrix communis]|nr:MAG: hypothetical protein QTN59_17305 [Candidatus Electrothrix communis]
MDNVKRSVQFSETAQTDNARKQPYVKPSMKTISLFADEVLVGCGKLTTDPVPEGGCGLAISSS